MKNYSTNKLRLKNVLLKMLNDLLNGVKILM